MFGLRKRVVAIGAAAILAVTALTTVALADTPTPTATPGASAAATPGATTTATPRTDYGQVFLGKLATALGVDQATLVAKIKQAEVDTISQAVANGDLAKNPAAALTQRVQQSTGVGPLGIFGLGGRGGGTGPGPVSSIVNDQTIQQAVADKLGLSLADLQTQLQSGTTLASLAKAHNVQVQDLYDAAANAAKPQLDAAVKAGTITQAQADQITKQLENGQYVLGKAMGGGPGPMGRPFSGRGFRGR